MSPVERGELEPLVRLRERIRPFFLRRSRAKWRPSFLRGRRSLFTSSSTRRSASLRRAAGRPSGRCLEARREVGVLAALEALLRLRQAACHPALVPGQWRRDRRRRELLLDTLETVAAEGHKALVFSQWTSMLDLLEPHLRDKGLTFARLDGSTRDRAAVVERFQNDPAVRSSSSRSRREGSGSTSPRPTTSFSSIPGGIPRWRSRPSTGRTASARTSRCSFTASLPRTRWKSAFSPSRTKSAPLPVQPPASLPRA